MGLLEYQDTMGVLVSLYVALVYIHIATYISCKNTFGEKKCDQVKQNHTCTWKEYMNRFVTTRFDIRLRSWASHNEHIN